MKIEKSAFSVCKVTREDLRIRGYQHLQDDRTMLKIATEMSELITSCDFWTALDLACEKYGVQKLAVC